MRKEGAGVLALLGLLLSAPQMARADGSSTPGKNSAAATVSELDLSTPQTVSVQISKGQKKRLLKVEGSLVTGPTPIVLAVFARANGVAMEPGLTSQKCDSGGDCSVNLIAWLDLDAAEAANPGLFIKVPITVEFVINFVTVGLPGKATVVATMVKK
jgi:hypothetical protein